MLKLPPVTEPLPRPKSMRMSAYQYIIYSEQTDRFILWLISVAPHAYNPLYFMQYTIKDGQGSKEGDSLSVALQKVTSLQNKRFIRQDKDFNWHVTFKGQVHRFSTHVYTEAIKPFTGPIVAISLFFITYWLTHTSPNKQPNSMKESILIDTNKNTNVLIDSVSKVDSPPIVKKGKDSIKLH